jgi:hypothetical protein
VVLGGSLVAGEKVVVEEDHELSRHGTEPGLQIYSHSFANLSVLFVQSAFSPTLAPADTILRLYRDRFDRCAG